MNEEGDRFRGIVVLTSLTTSLGQKCRVVQPLTLLEAAVALSLHQPQQGRVNAFLLAAVV